MQLESCGIILGLLLLKGMCWCGCASGSNPSAQPIPGHSFFHPVISTGDDPTDLAKQTIWRQVVPETDSRDRPVQEMLQLSQKISGYDSAVAAG